jgi:peroxiredoxin
MAIATQQGLELGQHAPDFDLEATDGKRYRLADIGGKATLVMFICNHCPYVRAVLHDVIRDVRELAAEGVKAIAIMPNDAVAYPADSFEAMRNLAEAEDFPFPYAIDRTQDVARAYGAVCTPEFYGFNAARELQYRGRIYALQNLRPVPGGRRELFEAMVTIARTGQGPAEQHASMGCSIKWRRLGASA